MEELKLLPTCGPRVGFWVVVILESLEVVVGGAEVGGGDGGGWQP